MPSLERRSAEKGRALPSLAAAEPPLPDLVPSTDASCASFPIAFRIGTAHWTFPANPDFEEDGSRSPASRVLHRFGRDQAEIYSAPFRAKNFKWDIAVFGATAPLIAFDERISRSLPGAHRQLQLDFSHAALVGTSATLGALWIKGWKANDEHARETGILGLEAVANSFTVYTALQLMAARERPTEAGGLGRFFQHASINTSFPSGHAMFTFAMASVVAHEYPKRWVQVVAYSTATAAGVMRFTGRRHFASDVVVGSVLGYLIGTHIFHARCRPGLSAACHVAK